MRKRLIFLVLFLGCAAAPALAGPAAMVSELKGKVTRDGTSRVVKVGNLLPEDTRLSLQEGSEVKLVYFKNRKTEKLNGSGSFKVGAAGALDLRGVRLAETKAFAAGGGKDPLVDNPVVIGGMTVRNGEEVPEQHRSGIHSLELTIRENRIQSISWETESPGAYDLEIVVADDPMMPSDARVPAPTRKLENGRSLYVVDSLSWAPQLDPGVGYKLTIENSSQREPRLVQRFRSMDASQKEILESAVQEFSDWAEADPKDPVPLMLQMALYDQLDQLGQAATAGQRALDRARGMAEEQEVRSRLSHILEELGRWDELEKLQ
ncbi:MAG: hypothetical protein HY319_11035 [Armatimonadetes bacterium]|nr:hypothetical protein [Armatimonadota bacterium]